jgi:protein-tyrosine phosphatase
VAPWLVIGPALHPKQYRRLSDLGVTHVVDLRAEAHDDHERLHASGIEWRRLAIIDRAAPTTEQVRELLAWLEERGDAVVYLHCQGGLGRAPTMAVALLVARGFTPTEALSLVRAARPEIEPTEVQRAWVEALQLAAEMPEPRRASEA